ncbi:MAG: hypothetical protein E6Q97_29885 [Desulfurellales bacterium]|nr:MAG: hypothetical protein E6Q97_29885 [Desulfurellales bacterium]
MSLIEDEYGIRWQVGNHDPARKVVTSLEGLGFSYIVLPRHILAGTGQPSNHSPEGLRRQVRLLDCVEAGEL